MLREVDTVTSPIVDKETGERTVIGKVARFTKEHTLSAVAAAEKVRAGWQRFGAFDIPALQRKSIMHLMCHRIRSSCKYVFGALLTLDARPAKFRADHAGFHELLRSSVFI